MSYILMAEQEEGSEMRISEFDPGPRGFNTACEAGRFIHKARERYPEFRRIWVEMLRAGTVREFPKFKEEEET